METLHAIMIPFPAQGHITPMLQLALKLLHQTGGFQNITFINTQYNHDLILANGQSMDLLQVPGLTLATIDDGLPPDHGRLNDSRIQQFAEAIDALHEPLQKLIQEMVATASASQVCPPITCIISDCFFYWMADIAATVSLPWVAFWTSPIHANLAYCFMSHLWIQGILPVNCQQRESTERMVDCIPGVEALQASDLPSFLQSPDGSPNDFFFQWCLKRFGAGVPQRASWHLGNTIYELDQQAAHAFQECIGKYVTIGPLLPPEFFVGKMDEAPAVGTSLWVEDEGCKEWLDKQQDSSVLYISFGSIVHMATQQVEEVAAGVEASGRPFLWVLRSDVDVATLAKLEAFRERTRERGRVVSWAPQLLVLSHPCVAAFLTHCGWNSMLEGICSGLPLLVWPGGFAEQKMNARYIVDVWRIGVGFSHELTKDGLLIVKEEEVERVILSVMSCEQQGQALRERVVHLQKLVRDALLPANGSSHTNLLRFLEAMSNSVKGRRFLTGTNP